MKAYFSCWLRISRRFLNAGAFSILIATVFLCTPHLAMAQTLGDLMCNVYNEYDPFINLMDAICYVGGGILIGAGLLHLKGHSENHQQHQLHQALARMIGGAALLGLPWFADFLVNTMFLIPSGNGAPSCIPGGSGTFNNSGSIGLDALVTNFVGNITDPMTNLISGAAVVMGVLFIIRGLFKGAKYGQDPRSNSVPHIAAYLIIGTILIVVGQSFSQVLGSIFGVNQASNSSSVLNWNIIQVMNASPQFIATIQAALTFFQLIGMLAFVRGWYIVKNAVEGAGQATMAQGFTHIIGGVLAINIYSFLEIMDATFGTNFL